jgi:hypothetical protein
VSGGPSDAGEGPWWATRSADRSRPVLVAGLVSTALLNGAGELSFVRETRGAALDWGGVYSQGVRLTGPWSTTLRRGDRSIAIGAETLRRLEHSPGGVEVDHAAFGLDLHDELRIPADGVVVCRTLTVKNPGSAPASADLEVGFSPFLAPVALEGVQPRRYVAWRSGPVWRARSFGFALAWESDPAPTAAFSAGTPWSAERRRGTIAPFLFRWTVALPPGAETVVHQRIAGGLLAGPYRAARCPLPAEPRRPEIDAEFRQWIAATPELSIPDAPRLERAYRLARTALRSLYTAPDEAIVGLVAGYPWYAALWGRDLAWMLPAVLWLGDFPWVERSLRSVFRFQARARLPVLGGSPGELPMQIAPGPVFLYGTSDTTLYYPGLVRALVERTGDDRLARELYPQLDAALAWASAKAQTPLGLLAHGNEIAEIGRETSVGRVRVGFDAVDTTIWDSTDRRDHALDVQVLWLEALEAMGPLATWAGQSPPEGLAERVARVRSALGERYRWRSEGYLYDSLARDGTPVPRVRPNALRLVRTGLLDPATARSVVERAAQEDLTTPWGVRTLSSRDPAYDPHAYHDGQVWTIATAWAADAALRAGESARGVRYLETNAARLIEEGGYAAECYAGDRPEPFDACFLLGFSVAPFITALFESLWGIEPRMSERALDVEPRFPAEWTSAALRGLRLGAGRLDLAWTPGELAVRWSGPGPLTVRSGPARAELAGGGATTVATRPSTPG